MATGASEENGPTAALLELRVCDWLRTPGPTEGIGGHCQMPMRRMRDLEAIICTNISSPQNSGHTQPIKTAMGQSVPLRQRKSPQQWATGMTCRQALQTLFTEIPDVFWSGIALLKADVQIINRSPQLGSHPLLPLQHSFPLVKCLQGVWVPFAISIGFCFCWTSFWLLQPARRNRSRAFANVFSRS